MAKFRGSAGGYVKFENPGDGVTGVVDSVSSEPNKFKGDVDVVIAVRTAAGEVKNVRCDKKALKGAAAKIMAEGGFKRGERIAVIFESSYSTKFSNPGKDITIDLLDRIESTPGQPVVVTAPADVTAGTATPEVELAYAMLVKAKGESDAKDIRKAVEQVVKGDSAKQADLLTRAAAA